MKKIGIMGGTFNPIHYGHLFLAENAYEQIGLDQVLFMLTKNPPHKVKLETISDQQRTDMVRLAIQDNPHFTISTMELERDGVTYTSDTLTLLAKEKKEISYYFIVGADSLMMMQDWHDPRTIFQLCTVVAASRDKIEKEQLQRQAQYLKERYHADILLLDMPTMQISSANIRERVAEGKSIRYYLPEAVEEYIQSNGLYLRSMEEKRR
jgi:nicotinate-nucleotide adenylyltransferase